MALLLDDRDAAVQYSSDWGNAGVAEEFRGTTSFTETVGATARVTFTGRGIAVVGTITIRGVKESPVSSYIIDDNPATRFQFTGEQTDQIQRGATFYRIDNLDYGQHTLTITCDSTAGILYLDYFEIIGFENPGSSSSSSTTGGSTSDPALPSSQGQSSNSSPFSTSGVPPIRGTSTSNNLPTSSSDSGLPAGDDTQRQSSDDGPPVGAIAGGVVGGVAVICIAILIFLLCKRRERRRRDRELVENYSAPAIQPFITPQAGNASGHYAPSGYGVSNTPIGSGSSHHTGMMNNQYSNYQTHVNASGYSMPVSAGYNHAHDYNPSMRDTVSPVPVSSASMVSGLTGGSSGHPPAVDSRQHLVVHAAPAAPHKLVSNMAAAPPNRAPEADAPPGYQG